MTGGGTMNSEGFDFVTPPETHLQIDGREVVVTPLTIGDLPRMIALAEPLLDEMMLMDQAVLGRMSDGAVDPADVATLVGLCARQGDKVIQAVALACRVPQDFIGGLLPDRFVALATASIQVNRDFFVQAMPALRSAATRLMTARESDPAAAGQKPSSSS